MKVRDSATAGPPARRRRTPEVIRVTSPHPELTQAFVHSWAVFVAIERHPERAARLRELERIVDSGERDPVEAIAGIRAIREVAEAEAGL